MTQTTGATQVGETFSEGATAAYIIGLILALAMFAGNEYVYQRAQLAFATMHDLDRASASVQQVVHRLVDAESSQRGYLLTSRKDYLLPGADARRDIESALTDLRTRFRMAPDWKPYLDALAQATAERLSELQETLTLHDQGRVDAARQLFLTDIGREKMQAVRQSALSLLSIGHRQADAERTRVVSTLELGRIGVHATLALSLLWFIYYLRKSAALQKEQRLHANDLQRERERLEAEVKTRTQELRGLNERLQLIREDERGRVARTLHDELGAILTAAKLDMARLRRLVERQQPAQALVRLDHLTDTLDQGIHLKRRIMEELMPSALHNFGLREAVEILAEEFSANTGFSIDLALQEVAASERSRVLAYRWIESALADIQQHTPVSSVQISLKALPGDMLQVSVSDDGDTASTTMLVQSQDDAAINLRHRIEGLGGSVVVKIVPGHGSVRMATVPAGAYGESDAASHPDAVNFKP